MIFAIRCNSCVSPVDAALPLPLLLLRPGLVLHPPKGVVPLCSSCATPLQRQPLVRPIPLLVLLTVGGVLVASSIPILFTPNQLPAQGAKNWPKAGFSVQYVGIGAFMTLGRFLIFFVIGLVLALTIPQLTWLLWPLAASALFVVVQLIRS